MGDDGVDEPVAAAVGEVVLGEAEAQQVVGVVLQTEVEPRVVAGDPPGARRRPLDDDRELGRDERVLRRGARGRSACDRRRRSTDECPSVRSPARSSIFGPAPPRTRFRRPAAARRASRPSKNARIVLSGRV